MIEMINFTVSCHQKKVSGLESSTNYQKIIYGLTAIFYLLTSQIYPYIHLHSHDHNGEVLFEICTTQSSSQLATHQCCEAHQNEHQHFLSDRQYIAKHNPYGTHSDLVSCLRTTWSYEPDFRFYLSGMDNILPACFYLSNNLNKAPPATS